MADEMPSVLRRLALLFEDRLPTEDLSEAPKWQRFLHFWLLVGRSFLRNRCPVRASALAYTTLLALIPLLAVALSVSASLLNAKDETARSAMVQQLIDKFIGNIAPQLNLDPQGGEKAQANRQQVVKQVVDFIGNTQSGKLGATGTIGLVFVAIMLLSNIEAAFNDIWGVARGRGWVLRVVNYWALITLGPILFAVALGLTTSAQMQMAQDFIMGTPMIGRLIFKVVPFLVPCAGFTVFYKLMPNTRVTWLAALVGGVLGGVLWQLNNIFNVVYVSNVVTYSKIYGSLALVPVFLLGLYFSWLILLLGAQIGYAFQNREIYLQERQAENVNQRSREFVAVRLMTAIAQRFAAGRKPPTIIDLSREVGVPGRLATQILAALERPRLVQQTGNEGAGYSPGRPLETISVQDILDALRTANGRELATADDETRTLLRAQFEKVREAERAVAGSMSLHELVKRDG